MEPSGYIFLAIGSFLLVVLSYVMAKASQSGNFSRYSTLGIRTKQTMHSDAAWSAVHKKSAPYMMAAALVGTVSIVLDIAFLVAYEVSDWNYPQLLIIVPVLRFVAKIVVLASAMTLANSEAKNITTENNFT